MDAGVALLEQTLSPSKWLVTSSFSAKENVSSFPSLSQDGGGVGVVGGDKKKNTHFCFFFCGFFVFSWLEGSCLLGGCGGGRMVGGVFFFSPKKKITQS